MENPFEVIMEKLDRIERMVTIIRENQEIKETQETSKEIMNVQQVADYLSISKQTVYGMTCRMEVPFYKRGKKNYFKKRDIDEWLLATRRKTREEIEMEALTYLKVRGRCK